MSLAGFIFLAVSGVCVGSQDFLPQSQSDHGGDWLNNYVGDVGTNGQRFGMTLIFRGTHVIGTFFFAGKLVDRPVAGTLRGRQLVLQESSAAGKYPFTFSGQFLAKAKDDPRGEKWSSSDLDLGAEVYTGTVTVAAHKTTQPFYLAASDATYRPIGEGRYAIAGSTDDTGVERKAQSFWRAVQDNDKRTVAACMFYPLRVNLDGRSQVIPNREDLLARYDKIFTDRFRARIAAAIPHNMFAKSDGVMLGNGDAWLGECGVFALNVDD